MPGSGKDAKNGHGEISPEDRQAIRDRASDIGKRLDQARARKAETAGRTKRQPLAGSHMGQALRFATDLVAGVGVGGGIGWLLDRQFGSTPWLLALFVVLGFAAGLLNIIRAARKMQAEMEPLQRSQSSVRDDDEER